MRIKNLFIYPIKSCGGIEVNQFTLDHVGPMWDRDFMVVNAEGKFFSQRTHPQMCHVRVAFESDHLLVSIPNIGQMAIDLSSHFTDPRAVEVWGDTCVGYDQGSVASDLFSTLLGEKCYVVRHNRNNPRRHESSRLGYDFPVSFADAYPLLIISQESLNDLNGRMEAPLPMNRFRPNIVVEGGMPYIEDSGPGFQCGSVYLKFVKLCERCPIPLTDQDTGERGKEPLRTLARYRKGLIPKGVPFGSSYVHESIGTLEVGMEVVPQ